MELMSITKEPRLNLFTAFHTQNMLIRLSRRFAPSTNYKGRLKDGPQVYKVLLLLLLTTYASTWLEKILATWRPSLHDLARSTDFEF